MKQPNFKDITGQRFGRLIVVEKAGNDRRGAAMWRCRCDCGGERTVRGSDLRNGHTTSCGCIHSEGLAARNQSRRKNGMEKRLYIAYGSNLDKAQMAMRCPGAKPVATSWLHDYRLTFQGNPYGAHANVIPEEGKNVPVAIWEITAKDEASLDIYEGVRGGYYTKEFFEVDVNGEMREALIYIMTPRNYGIPTEDYTGTIAKGYLDFNMDLKILQEALDHAISNSEGREHHA